MMLWYDIRQSVIWARDYRYYVPFLEKFAYWYWLFSVTTVIGYYN